MAEKESGSRLIAICGKGGSGKTALTALMTKSILQRMRGNVFVDLRNVYEPTDMRQIGFDYVCVGR